MFFVLFSFVFLISFFPVFFLNQTFHLPNINIFEREINKGLLEDIKGLENDVFKILN